MRTIFIEHREGLYNFHDPAYFDGEDESLFTFIKNGEMKISNQMKFGDIFEYTGASGENVWPTYVDPNVVYNITWDNAVSVAPDSAVISFDSDYTDRDGVNCALLIVKLGSAESGKNKVTITATTDAPAIMNGDNAVPIFYQRNPNRDPYLVSANTSNGTITSTCFFNEATYMECCDESINLLMPYDVFKLNKPLRVRVVPE